MFEHLGEGGRQRRTRNGSLDEAVDPHHVAGGQIARLVGIDHEISFEQHGRHAPHLCNAADLPQLAQNGRITPGTRNFCGYNRWSDAEISHRGRVARPGTRGTIDGMPAGLSIDLDALNAQLRRRQGGYGRGRRMQIESDTAEIIAGVRRGRTTGAPIALLIRNRDLGQLATDDAPRGGDAGGRHRVKARERDAPAPGTRRPRRRHQSTVTTTSVTSSSAPALARPLPASPPAALRVSCSVASASGSRVTSRRSVTSCCQPSVS
jgi:hypothetical protein